MLSCIATPNHPWHQRHYHYIHWVRTTRQWTIVILSFQKIESLVGAFGLVSTRLHTYAYIILQFMILFVTLICYSNFLFLSSQGFVKLLRTILAYITVHCLLTVLQHTQTWSGITACLLTTARILTASVFLSILKCILLLDSWIFLVLRVYKLALRLQMCPLNQCMLRYPQTVPLHKRVSPDSCSESGDTLLWVCLIIARPF